MHLDWISTKRQFTYISEVALSICYDASLPNGAFKMFRPDYEYFIGGVHTYSTVDSEKGPCRIGFGA